MATRQEMIEQLTREDAEILTTLQGKNADNIVRDIEHIKEGQQALRHEKMTQWGEENGYNKACDALEKQRKEGKLDTKGYIKAVKELNQKYGFSEQYEKVTKEVEKLSAAARCGLPDSDMAYCIALQNQAMNDAVEDAKKLGVDSVASMNGSLGWGCANAALKFRKEGYGQAKTIGSLYTMPNGDREHCVVKKDKEGKPLINDGDIALLHNAGRPVHAVRLNVDKETGEVTYTAGNEERNHYRISYLGKCNATIIPMQDYVQNQAKAHYQNMSDEKLAALIAEREAKKPLLHAQLQSQQGEPVNNPQAESQKIKFDERIKAKLDVDAQGKLHSDKIQLLPEIMKAQNSR